MLRYVGTVLLMLSMAACANQKVTSISDSSVTVASHMKSDAEILAQGEQACAVYGKHAVKVSNWNDDMYGMNQQTLFACK
jgi:hypothetical protein